MRAVRPEDEPKSEPPPKRVSGPTPDLGPPVPEVGVFDESDPGDGVLDRVASWLLEPEVEDRMRTATQRLGGYPYDSLGLSPRTARRALALFRLLYRYYFRVESRGHERIPEKGGAILAGNHGGLETASALLLSSYRHSRRPIPIWQGSSWARTLRRA